MRLKIDSIRAEVSLHPVRLFLFAATLTLSFEGFAQKQAQKYALSDFAIASALVAVPAVLDDTVQYAVLENGDLYALLRRHKTFLPFGYKRFVLSRLARKKPIEFSRKEIKDYGITLASMEQVSAAMAIDTATLVATQFDTRGLLLPDEEQSDGAAIVTALFLRGVIVSMDDESGVAYLDNGWQHAKQAE